uniref:Guanine nucleotide-binding protein subunit gamma n=2 Tax=Sparus aurata TaxID=8175 RepID=A0A671V467_SPAAU
MCNYHASPPPCCPPCDILSAHSTTRSLQIPFPWIEFSHNCLPGADFTAVCEDGCTFEHSCPKTAMSSKMQSSSSIAHARRTVHQLRVEASIERIKVSKASSDLMRYCAEHAKNDPLLMGIPASENPFKDKKPCTVL